jgi:ankyrin repeat protein
LHLAAYNGESNEILTMFIDAGADAKATNHNGETPADVARKQNRVATAEFLESLYLPPVKSANRVV